MLDMIEKVSFRKIFFFVVLFTYSQFTRAQVDYSVVSVPQEAGLEFMRITSDNDYVCMPSVNRTYGGINWLTNRILSVSADGNHLAYLSYRNETTNIFIKDIRTQGSSMQRTNRQHVLDFSYSPDGKYLVFSETDGNMNQLFQTDARAGYVCRQITSGNQDYSPVYSNDMQNIFFARQEANGVSIWSYNVQNNFLSSYARGMNPFPVSSSPLIVCVRNNPEGRGEIWRVNTNNSVEECILSDARRSFTTPMVSPNGEWILCVGSSMLMNGTMQYWNTDIFACKVDGTQLLQLTYHAADDLSPVWSRDGQYVYFISQRGSSTGVANVWRIKFRPF